MIRGRIQKKYAYQQRLTREMKTVRQVVRNGFRDAWYFVSGATLILLIGAVSACGGGGGGSSAAAPVGAASPDVGQLIVGVTDAEGDFLVYDVAIDALDELKERMTWLWHVHGHINFVLISSAAFCDLYDEIMEPDDPTEAYEHIRVIAAAGVTENGVWD